MGDGGSERKKRRPWLQLKGQTRRAAAFKLFAALALPSRIQTDDAFETLQLSPESGWLALTRFSGSAKFNYTGREE